MTTTATPTPDSTSASASDFALVAASAAAAVLPAVEQLLVAEPQPGDKQALAGFGGAAVAEIDGQRAGRVAVLVGEELTAALASGPGGGLDLGAAAQPALDAVAETVGGNARAARSITVAELLADFGPAFTLVPLTGAAGVSAAVLIEDHLLQPAPAEEEFVAAPAAEPAELRAPENVTPLPRRGIEMLHGVDMEVTVELGRTRMTVRDLLALTPGAVLELDRAAGSPADLLVNGRLIARGEVVVVDEDFGLRVTEIVDDSAAG
jgi:flagellar motor switch protein FliN/FliY